MVGLGQRNHGDILTFQFSYHHTACRQVQTEPNTAAMRFDCRVSHSRCTRGTMGVSPLTHTTNRKPWGKDRHLGPPDRTPDDKGFSIEPSVQAARARSARWHSGRVAATLCDATIMPNQTTLKEKGDATCKQNAIPINDHIPPCRPASNPAQWRRPTPRRIASQYEVSRRGICSSPEPAVSAAHPTSAHHLNPCMHMWWPPLWSSTTGCNR